MQAKLDGVRLLATVGRAVAHRAMTAGLGDGRHRRRKQAAVSTGGNGRMCGDGHRRRAKAAVGTGDGDRERREGWGERR